MNDSTTHKWVLSLALVASSIGWAAVAVRIPVPAAALAHPVLLALRVPQARQARAAPALKLRFKFVQVHPQARPAAHPAQVVWPCKASWWWR